MKATPAVGAAMILGAALLGAVLAVGMYQGEVADRTRQASAAAPAAPRTAPTPAAPTAPAAAAPAAPPVAQATPAAGAAASSGGDVAAGEKLYAGKCNACHPNANAGVGPALRGPQFAATYLDDASLKQIIRSGRGGMPPYPPANLSDGDLEAMVAYLRSLQ